MLPAPAAHKKKGGRRRSIAQIDKDAQALKLHCEGKSYQEIAGALGWRNRSSAFEAVKRAAADRARMALGQEDTYTTLLEQIYADIARCTKIINTPHYAVTASGKIATGPDGEMVLDDGPSLRAITELRHLRDQLIMLKDMRPASKQRVEVVTEDIVQREIDQLAKEIAEAGKNKPVPSE